MKKKTKIIFVLSAFVIVSLIATYVILSKKGNNKGLACEEIGFATLKEEVSTTGKVKAAKAVDLGFEAVGKINNVYVKVAEEIKQGDVLISLTNVELKANLLQYQANYQTEKAVLDELLRGEREEEITLAQTKVRNAKIDLKNKETAKENVENEALVALDNIYDKTPEILQTAYTKTDDAINKQIDELFTNGASQNPKLSFQTANSQAGIDVEAQRILANNGLLNFKLILDAKKQSQSDNDEALLKVENYLNVIQTFLNTLSLALNNSANLSQANLNTYKGYLTTARTNVSQELSNINTQKQNILSQKAQNQSAISTAQSAIDTAENTLETAKNELALKLAGAAEEQIQAQKAKVDSSLANIKSMEAKIEKTIIRAPFGGIVTKISAIEGEVVSANTPLVSLISKAKFEIETNVPEVDIAKIKIGDRAKVTLDAYDVSNVFSAVVSQINLSETMVEGVSTYKTVLQFTEEDERIRPGMTANLDILTAQKENVLSIPTRAIISKNGSKTVRIMNQSGETEEISVETGMKSSDGRIEILNGLQTGDKVITSY